MRTNKYIGLLMALILLVSPVMVVLGAEGTTTGSVTILSQAGQGKASDGTITVGNAAPSITSVALTDTGSNSVNGQPIDVDVEYWVTIDVTDNNNLDDLDQIVFELFETGSSSKGDGSLDETDHYKFRYVQGTGWEEIGPDAGGSHIVLADCSEPADEGVTSGTYRLAFKLDKLAKATDTDSWTVDITVTDESSATDNDATLSYGVNFYYELTLVDTSHGWTNVAPGDTDVLLQDPADNIDITVTANADFDVQAKAESTDFDVSNIKIHQNDVNLANPLSGTFTDIGGLTGISAGENIAKAFQLWLTVPTGTSEGSYSYTLRIQVEEA